MPCDTRPSNLDATSSSSSSGACAGAHPGRGWICKPRTRAEHPEMPKALCIYGTRPEAIKMAPVILACRQHPSLQPVLCATAQHRELLDEINQTFDLVPDHDLALMRPDQTLPELTARAITAITEVLQAVRPQV